MQYSQLSIACIIVCGTARGWNLYVRTPPHLVSVRVGITIDTCTYCNNITHAVATLTCKNGWPASFTQPMTTSELTIPPLGDTPNPTQPFVDTFTTKLIVSAATLKFQYRV